MARFLAGALSVVLVGAIRREGILLDLNNVDKVEPEGMVEQWVNYETNCAISKAGAKIVPILFPRKPDPEKPEVAKCIDQATEETLHARCCLKFSARFWTDRYCPKSLFPADCAIKPTSEPGKKLKDLKNAQLKGSTGLENCKGNLLMVNVGANLYVPVRFTETHHITDFTATIPRTMEVWSSSVVANRSATSAPSVSGVLVKRGGSHFSVEILEESGDVATMYDHEGTLDAHKVGYFSGGKELALSSSGTQGSAFYSYHFFFESLRSWWSGSGFDKGSSKFPVVEEQYLVSCQDPSAEHHDEVDDIDKPPERDDDDDDSWPSNSTSGDSSSGDSSSSDSSSSDSSSSDDSSSSGSSGDSSSGDGSSHNSSDDWDVPMVGFTGDVGWKSDYDDFNFH